MGYSLRTARYRYTVWVDWKGRRLDSGIGESLYGQPSFRFTDAELKAVPYALWCNRTPGEMIVWINALIS